MKYGPNTTEIERILEQMEAITPEQFSVLRLCDAIPEEAWERSVTAICEERYWNVWMAVSLDMRGDVPPFVWSACRDALMAAILSPDVIPSGDIRTLRSAWESAMGGVDTDPSV